MLFQDTSPTSPAGQAEDPGVERELRANPDVARVTGYLGHRARTSYPEDGSATYLAVSLKPTGDKDQQDAAKAIADALEGQPGVSVGGIALAQEQVNKQVEKDLRMAELLAFPILFLLSLLFFRSAVAALLPLLIGGLAIVGTFFLLRLANEVVSVSIFALNLTTGLGLGLAIDYSLFVVSRYREEIAKFGPGRRGDEANTEHRRPHGPVLLDHGRRRTGLADGLPAALPLLDGDSVERSSRCSRRLDRTHGPAGGAGAARQPRQRLGRRTSCSGAPSAMRPRPSPASGTGSRASSCAARSRSRP